MPPLARWTGALAAVSLVALGAPVGAQARALLSTFHTKSGWGIKAGGPGLSAVRQPTPLEGTYDANPATKDAVQEDLPVVRGAYAKITPRDDGFVGTGSVSPATGVTISFVDRWTVDGAIARLARTVTVHGAAPGGFNSGIELE